MPKLLKVEGYRFFKNLAVWVLAVGLLCMALFLSSDQTDLLLAEETIEGIITSTMKITNLLIVLIVSVAIGTYVGKEFKQKTICYEIMRGFRFWQISFIKTIPCGFILAAILQGGIILYASIMQKNCHVYSLERYLLMYLIICHICTCVVLFAMLFKDGAIGGCLAFVRFTMLNVAALFLAEIVLPRNLYELYTTLSPMSQWSVVINVGYSIPVNYIIGIILSFLMEYMLLMFIIHMKSKNSDY